MEKYSELTGKEWPRFNHEENLSFDTIQDWYAALCAELEKLEAENPELATDDSPTKRVGSEVRSELPPHEHKSPMLSLANAFSEDELRDFDRRCRKLLGLDENEPIEYMCEPKLDGLAVSLEYSGAC